MSDPIELTTDPAAHNPDYLREVAQSIAEAVRVCNHATHPGNGCPGLEYPSDAYILIAALASASGRLVQLLEQTRWFLHGCGDLADDRGTDPAVTATAAGGELLTAASHAGALSAALDKACQEASHLYVKEIPGE